MDIDQLREIGKEVAKRIESRMGFEEIGFYALERDDGMGFTAGGLIIRAGNDEQEYTLSRVQVEELLGLSQTEAQARLEGLISVKVRGLFGLL